MFAFPGHNVLITLGLVIYLCYPQLGIKFVRSDTATSIVNNIFSNLILQTQSSMSSMQWSSQPQRIVQQQSQQQFQQPNQQPAPPYQVLWAGQITHRYM